MTIDGHTYPAPSPFMVLATQNPVETTGTYPLPEAQLDRFFMRLSMGYPSHEEEIGILQNYRTHHSSLKLPPVASAADVLELQKMADGILCSVPILDYITSIVESTRSLREVLVGVSPRGAIALMQAARGCALLSGRSYVLPDDVQRMAFPVLCHRLIMRGHAAVQRQTPESIVDAILRTTSVPAIR